MHLFQLLTYLDIDTIPRTDMCIYPKSNKIGIFTDDGFIKIYKIDSDVNYYEGE